MRAGDILRQLRAYESRNVTFLDPDGSWPIVWDRARDVHVWDVAGRKYLDLTAAFGVAAAGHANLRVVRAGQRQLARLPHAMGDVHPHPLKARLARELSGLTFERWGKGGKARATDRRGKTLFCNSGFEAVEAALKTAILATGRREIVAFRGGYHGLGYGALNVTSRAHFRAPFEEQLGQFGQFVAFPATASELGRMERELRRVLGRGRVAAILAEPIQGRGGMRVPPTGFLEVLRQCASDHQALLILDEVYTGFGRTGRWFACEHSGVVPDILCLGKALTGGFPLSACVGRAEVMDGAWPASTGEAIHTSTFLGHPVGCAMALAQINEIRSGRLWERSEKTGALLQAELKSMALPGGLAGEVRGRGLMVGLELRQRNGLPATEFALRVVKGMLAAGYILLPEGESGEVIGFTPPLTITEAQVKQTVRALAGVMAQVHA
ncbi:MAG: aspartate aminotransferase family protein [Verrucomicrobia bacterium]|nr:aspartate aminotransferase family protein [Verrucomicrobiota bacterium]